MSFNAIHCGKVHAAVWNGTLQCTVSLTQKVTHLNTSQYATSFWKGSAVFSYNLFISLLPAWQGVTILFIDGSSS